MVFMQRTAVSDRGYPAHHKELGSEFGNLLAAEHQDGIAADTGNGRCYHQGKLFGRSAHDTHPPASGAALHR